MTPKTLIYTAPSLNTAINMASTPSTKNDGNSKVTATARFTNDEVIMMKLYYHLDHKTYSELAVMFNTDYQMVYGIINKKKYKTVRLNFMTKIPEEFHEATNNKYRSFKVKGHN